MADLDDFFAKKDRKKSKATKKFTTTDEVAKKLEDNAKKTEKVKKDRIPEGEEGVETPVHEQDEWKDFEEEKKDYTGLKIGNLTLNTNEAGDVETNIETQQGYDESGQETEKKSGPWKRVDVEVQEQQAPPPKTEQKKPDPPKTGTYVPPSLRNLGQHHHQIQPSRLKSKAAPDVHNEELFPTLSKTNDHKKNRSEGSFEVVQHTRANSSYRQSEQTRSTGWGSGQGPKLSLGNRYNTLSSNDS